MNSILNNGGFLSWQKPVYKRVLLKISGEALAGDKHTGLILR